MVHEKEMTGHVHESCYYGSTPNTNLIVSKYWYDWSIMQMDGMAVEWYQY